MSLACCICSSLLDTFDPKTEKPVIADKSFECCSRTVCLRCLTKNPRYSTYCPYCQVSTSSSVLPQGLREPPAYDSLKHHDKPHPTPQNQDQDPSDDCPPRYSEVASSQPPNLGSSKAQDVLHFVLPADSLQSISLAYGVPLSALRSTNNMYADHLLQGRKTLLIPGEYYKSGISLSPHPVESEEEQIRKTKIRRFMVACKVAEYDVAVLYLQQADYDLELAIEAFLDDEKWEREHPIAGTKEKSQKSAKSVGMRRFVGLPG